MCIAIYKKEKQLLTVKTLQNCWDNNPHGAGFMFAENKKLHVIKGLMTFDAFMEAYKPHAAKQCVLHFRIATHGDTNETNTHPFLINDKLGIVHNGIINNIACDINKNMSDTWHLVEKILKPLHIKHKDLWLLDPFITLMENFIGHSKLILLDNTGNCVIYKESIGNWNSECWFSNTSYETRIWAPVETYRQKKNKANKVQHQPLTAKPLLYDNDFNQDDNITFNNGPFIDANPGDFVTLHFDEFALPVIGGNPHEVIKAGTKVQIKTISGQYRILVENPINNLQTYSSLWRLKAWEPPLILENNILEINGKHTFNIGQEIIFAKNYNHFRIGKHVTVSACTANFVLIQEKDTFENGIAHEKTYSIPNYCVRPLTELLM